MWKLSGIIFFTALLSFANLSPIFEHYMPQKERIIEDPPFYNADSAWVDSVMKTMSPDERIAQLFMVQAYSNKDLAHENYISNLISEYHIGGLIFMQGGPGRQVRLVNKYQSLSKVPLLIAMDAEWSLSMRLDSTVLYPRQMMLGAIQDNQIIYEMGEEFARQLKRTGVHVNFAPVCDVNNNPSNPVINDRSFGEDKYNVALKSYYYMKGMQDNGVLATGKHFPGHGDTNVDSHKALPVINHNRDRLDSLELYPFRYLTEKGIGCFMVAHLFVPAIDSIVRTPTTLSPKAVKVLLKEEIGFKGLVFTDALNMGGVANHYKPGEADIKALLAGNDILLFPNEIPLVMGEIRKAIERGDITQEEIDSRCRKVLMAKYWAGLNKFEPIPQDKLFEELNDVQALLMQQKLIENSLTLVTNENSIIPLMRPDTLKIASLSFGISVPGKFQNRLKYYAKTDDFVYSRDISKYGHDGLLKLLADYNLVIISIHKTSSSPSKKFGISDETIKFVDDISASNNVILDIFGNPYSLGFFANAAKCKAVIISYNDWELTNDLSAQLIFGGIPALGRLPVTASQAFPVGMGVDTEKIRLKYTNIPEEAGVDSEMLYKVDSVMNEGIKAGAYPGGQIVAARNGIVFYCKSFGYHDYTTQNPVKDHDLYDMASVTKVIATTPALMKLFDEGKFRLDDKLSDYVPELKNTKKANFKIFDILTHRAGFKSWVPFYKTTILNDSVKNIVYTNKSDDTHSKRVCEGMFILDSYRDTIIQEIIKSDHNTYGKYVYSDMGFYLFPILIETKGGERIDNYLEHNFYGRIGAWTMTYLPLQKFDKDKVTPTEYDKIFRKEQLDGYVHDQGAAMMGGISGHAGLFASANDVAKIMQMFVNKGEYAGQSFIKAETVDLFTKYQFDSTVNRRGLGWDKPVPGDTTKGLGSGSASHLAYGHSGYTGTMVWADPHYDFIYVFNSNRVYQDAENWKILKMNTRTVIEEIFYQAILQKNPELKIKKN
jgi:beta-glucosidase-like glycosyl hydrolase/CubicO group peptidase (beta-lactamase class C family)